MIDEEDIPFWVGPLHFGVGAWRVERSTPADQPGFGVDLHWWTANRLLKPYLTLRIWRRRFQVGWLLD